MKQSTVATLKIQHVIIWENNTKSSTFVVKIQRVLLFLVLSLKYKKIEKNRLIIKKSKIIIYQHTIKISFN